MFRLFVTAGWELEQGSTVDYASALVKECVGSTGNWCVATKAQTAVHLVSDPNLNVWEVTCDQATMEAIEANPSYWIESLEEITDAPV